ncbi:glycosyltransferase [Methyloceanibacter sp.]|uniref:glycosyltransferase n=1 Tax=Methyloceanibacter sp. TaxID=1965321 RepID=UPI002D302549|nr:glycosyltransferase [Methyloceanibacter sp.]HZP07785.1 glycosyltransferase [Methyloceanibacter sp.]
MSATLVIAALALGIWVYLVLFRGFFWLAAEREDRNRPNLPEGANWPGVVAVIPARNEALALPRTLASLSAQDYPGKFAVVVVDDDSTDGTGVLARKAAAASDVEISVLQGAPLPGGWTGKVWAMQQGIAHAERMVPPPDYLLLTDADIDYPPDAVARLVARAKASRTVLTSLMVKLNCESLPERALIPAFVYFFQMLYPFAWVNRAESKTAAAAGGVMLVDRRALAKAGGIAKIRSALIDDCALARLLKGEGPIWLGLASDVRSSRIYPRFGDIRRMVARSAYAELDYSPLRLAGTAIGMVLTFIFPPIAACFAPFPANILAAVAFALMMLSFLPILRFYRRSALWAVALPAMAAAYLVFTLDSAYQHWRGRGGAWKGRSQALAAKR